MKTPNPLTSQKGVGKKINEYTGNVKTVEKASMRPVSNSLNKHVITLLRATTRTDRVAIYPLTYCMVALMCGTK